MHHEGAAVSGLGLGQGPPILLKKEAMQREKGQESKGPGNMKAQRFRV